MVARWRSVPGLVARVALVSAIASCGARAPARLDVVALVRARGPVEARHELELRIVADPADVGARLALASLADQLGRPSDAIAQLEAVVATGGPIGTRWRGEDRARLARLIAARGRARLERGAASALADLTRARSLGAKVDDTELRQARAAQAIAQLRHVDAKERKAATRALHELASTPLADPSWRGATASATAAQRGAFGAWAWSLGARRAGWEELRAWHAATSAPRDEGLASAYLAARAWWAPSDAEPPPVEDLVGPQRCRFAGAACTPIDLARAPRDDAAIAALVAAPPPPTRARTPAEAAAWLSITLVQALRGEAGWGAAFAARVELDVLSTAGFAPAYRAAFARITGRGEVGEAVIEVGAVKPGDRLVFAAGRALRGASAADVRAALGAAADTEDGREVLRIVEAPAIDRFAGAYPMAIVDHVRARVGAAPAPAALRSVLDAYARDPAIADRIAQDVIAALADTATGHAALGALFDALGDPGRARAAWQAAVDASPEPAHMRGLAEAMARASDPDAALIIGTHAAAAWGDPAIVWTSLARTLESVGRYQHALEAARSAIDLAGPDLLAAALAVAADASRGLGRTGQAEELAARRAKLSPPLAPERDDDPTDAAAALADHARHPTASVVARMWVASRWNRRHVAIRAALIAAIPGDDPRRRVLEAELVALAADRDPALGRAAVAALGRAAVAALRPR